MTSFLNTLHTANGERGYLVCGLDPVQSKIPTHLKGEWGFNPTMLIVQFLVPIIDAVAPYVTGFKPNYSFFIDFDDEDNCKFWGQEALVIICRYIRRKYPKHVLILDSKDGDIGASNNGYFRRAFDGYNAHAVTWNPYLGTAILSQLKSYPGRGVIVLGRTSNPEGTRFQRGTMQDGKQVYDHNIDQWLELWKARHPIGIVAGATHPEELRYIRKRVGAMPLLVPGVGTQGGSAIDAVRNGFGGTNGALMVNVSSGILYTSSGTDYAKESAGVAIEYAGDMRRVRRP